MTDSQKLIAQYVQTGSEAAFRKLVASYVDLVYSTALRLVEGDIHRAEDVAQVVFVDLARTARTLSQDVMLGGWLHRHTCYVAANTMRGERRRQSRERQAVEMNALQGTSGVDFSCVAPILDEAINELDEADRTAVLLRFFEQRDFRSVGEALSSNEDAARMRVNRALEKLESFLKSRGVTTSAAALAVGLSVNAVQAAPVGLALTISSAVIAGTTLVTSATATTAKAMAMTTIQKTIIGATLAIVAGVGIYEAQQAARLHHENERLKIQQAQLTTERDDALSAANAKDNELKQFAKDQSELLRLRGEVNRLRGQTQEMEKLRAENRQFQAAKASQSVEAEEEDSDPQRQFTIAKMSDAKLLSFGLLMYSNDNQDRYPTSLDQTSNYWSKADIRLSGTNQFEMVAPASLKTITNFMNTIVIREKNATLVNGKWCKAYAFADGHAEYRSEPPEGFEAWETQHIIPPPNQ